VFGVAGGKIAAGPAEAIALRAMGTVLSGLHGCLQHGIILAPFLFHHPLAYDVSIPVPCKWNLDLGLQD
jgi:hypothetical protein